MRQNAGAGVECPQPGTPATPGTPAWQARGFRDGDRRYQAAQWLVAGVLRLVAGVRVEGMERCPRHGPVILAANHRSMLDIPVLAVWCPRPVIFFSKVEVRRWPLVGWIATAFGSIFVRRGEADRQAMREALAALAAGRVIVFFPEGHRTTTGGLLRAQPGISLLAQRSGAPVWPVALTGTERMGKALRPPVTLRGGEPFDALAAAQAEWGPTPTHQQVADTIMRRIAALLPPECRGAYAPQGPGS